MDLNTIYAKTPIGDEAVRQSTRVVQRNLRMVLVQIDGKTSVGELSAKIGNSRLVEAAIRELAGSGMIVPANEAEAAWKVLPPGDAVASSGGPDSALSRFSTFGPKSVLPEAGAGAAPASAGNSQFSTFGKPILPAGGSVFAADPRPESAPPPRQAARWPQFGWLAPAAAVAVIASASLLAFYPYDRFKPTAETTLSQWVGAPVQIGAVTLRILPKPQLVLSGVRIADNDELMAEEIALGQPWRLFGRGPHALDAVQVTGATISADRLAVLPGLSGRAAVRDFSVQHVLFEEFKVRFGENQVLDDSLSGRFDFSSSGVFDKASLANKDRTLLVEVSPAAEGLRLAVEGRGWQPDGLGAPLASLQAKGGLTPGRLSFSDIDTTFLGGLVRGTWQVDWHNGMAMAGDAALLRLDAGKVSAALAPSFRLDGELSGSLRLRSRSSSDWRTLWRDAEVAIDAQIVRGVVHGVDLGEVARRSVGTEVRGGATRFDTLRATLEVNAQRVQVRNIRLDAGMMTASGQLTADRRLATVDGNLTANLRTSVNSLSVPVRIGGTPPNIVTSSRK